MQTKSLNVRQYCEGLEVSEVELIFKTMRKESQYISSSADAHKIIRPFYNDNTIELKEFFWIMVLARNNKVLAVAKISEGAECSTVVSTQLIAKISLLLNGQGVILSHNHPSGNDKPSEADNSLTKKVKEALKLFEINLLDHVILTDSKYYSYADNGLV